MGDFAPEMDVCLQTILMIHHEKIIYGPVWKLNSIRLEETLVVQQLR